MKSKSQKSHKILTLNFREIEDALQWIDGLSKTELKKLEYEVRIIVTQKFINKYLKKKSAKKKRKK